MSLTSCHATSCKPLKPTCCSRIHKHQSNNSQPSEPCTSNREGSTMHPYVIICIKFRYAAYVSNCMQPVRVALSLCLRCADSRQVSFLHHCRTCTAAQLSSLLLLTSHTHMSRPQVKQVSQPRTEPKQTIHHRKQKSAPKLMLCCPPTTQSTSTIAAAAEAAACINKTSPM